MRKWTATLRCYAPAIIIFAWALLLIAGVDADTTQIPFLVLLAFSVILAIREKDPRKRHGHH